MVIEVVHIPVQRLFDQREQPSRVLAVLSGAFCDLYRGFCACQAGVPAAQACAALGYPKNREFVLKNAISDSSRYQAGQLGKMLEALADADFMLKTSGGNERVVLEQTITKLFMLAERGSYA